MTNSSKIFLEEHFIGTLFIMLLRVEMNYDIHNIGVDFEGAV